MNDRQLYLKKMHAQLDEWKAEAAKLEARAEQADADAQLKARAHARKLEERIEAGRAELARVADAGEDRWESIKKNVQSAWASIEEGFRDAGEALKR